MKHGRILHIVFLLLIVLYFGCSLLMHSGKVSETAARYVSVQAGRLLGSDVSLGDIELVRPMGINMDNVIVKTPEGDTLASMSSATLRMKVLPLLKGRVEISGIRFLNPDIRLSRDSLDGPANYQYILDMFASDSLKKSGGMPYLSANSIIIKNGRIRYDVRNMPEKPGVLDGNHLDVHKINANISLKALDEDTLNLHIRSLGFEEKSGLSLKNLESKAIVSDTRSQISGFHLTMKGSDLRIDHLSADGSPADLADGSISISLPHFDARITPSDFAALVPELAEFNDNSILALSVSGRTDSIHIDNLSFRTSGNVLSGKLSGAITDITDNPGLESVSLQISSTNELYAWLSRNLSGFGLTLPDALRSMGGTDISLTADGDIRNNDADVFIKAGSNGTMTAVLHTEDGTHHLKVTSDDINVGRLAGIRNFGKTSFVLSADNVRLDSTSYQGNVRLDVPFVEYNGYRYSDIAVNLNSDGNRYILSMDADDENAAVSAEVIHNLHDRTSVANVYVGNLNLAATGLYQKDSISGITGTIVADIRGTDIDDIRGSVTIDSLIYMNSNGSTDLGNFVFSVSDMSDGGLLTSLGNDVINATIHGRYELSTIAGSFKRIVNSVSPELFMYINSGVKDNPSKYDNSFEANLSIRKNDLPQRIFNIPLSINEMLTVHAEIDDRSNGHELTVDAPSLQYGSNGISGFNMIVSGDGDMPFASVKGSYLSAKGKSATLYGFISGNDNLLNTSIIVWDNDSHSGTPAADLHADVALGPYNRKSGDIRLQTDIRNAYFKFNGRDWKVGNTTIVSDSGRYAIDNLVLSNELQSITIDGAIAADTSHTLSVAFDDICLDDITALLDKKTGLPLAEGYASGTVMASSILDRPIIYGNIETGAISFMGSRIDSLSAVGDWNGERQAVELKLDMLNGESLHTMAQGVYVPKNDSLDIYVRANRLDMYFLNRVIPKNTINEIRSLVTTGNLRICGNMKRLDFIGDAFIEDTYVDVTPNNVTYYVPEAVMNLRPGMFTFSDMDTYDLYGNYGIVDLNIRHTHLKRFMVNLQLQSNGIEVYDMPEKEYSQIYGRIFAGGTPRLSTRSGNVSITGNCMTAPGTWLDIKSGVNNATSYSFLTIKDASVSLEDFYDIREKEAATKKVRKNKSNLEINLNAELTDNAVIYAQMNSVSGSIRGSGNVVFKYDNREISMSGIYNITRGNCVLSLQQILRKEFSLLDNSRVTFNGSIGNTNLDIHASHTVNSVSMYDLDAKANGSSRVRARCLMDVTGTVSSPQLTFNVDAPQASAEDREMIASATSTEEQRNMQFMYLLTLGRFYTYDYSNAASLSANPVSAMQSLLNTTINGQINNLLSYMLNSDYVSLSSNLSTSYLSDDPTSFVDDTFEGILEAHLLNNRLILNGNFGYRKDNLNQTSSVIGDFELKWLLFPKAGISLLGYNRNNQRYYTKTTLYTQGFGVAYQNDFNSFSRKDSLKSEAVEKRKRRRRNQ